MSSFKLPVAVVRKLVKSYITLADEQGFQEWYARNKPVPKKESAKYRIRELEIKMDGHSVYGIDLHWEYCQSGTCHSTFLADEYDHFVPPNIYLVGEVSGIKFFKKFVSHPFYQLGRLPSAK